MTKHPFRYGEETYTIYVTKDDWWLEEPVDMSERMIKAANEFALENGMAPEANLCAGCNDGTYVDTKKDYHVGAKVIENLDVRKCDKCGHTILPWESVIKFDAAMQAKNEAV